MVSFISVDVLSSNFVTDGYLIRWEIECRWLLQQSVSGVFSCCLWAVWRKYLYYVCFLSFYYVLHHFILAACYCFSFCSKFDTLIQAQARELSHLRQRMREGRGVCNILTQHLGDTTKAFEELLRANDIDYYMGQSFRDQLAQSRALSQRVSSKISGREWDFGLIVFILHRYIRNDELTLRCNWVCD